MKFGTDTVNMENDSKNLSSVFIFESCRCTLEHLTTA